MVENFLTYSMMPMALTAPEPTQVGDYVITQKGLYIALFVIGIPMLYIAAYVESVYFKDPREGAYAGIPHS